MVPQKSEKIEKIPKIERESEKRKERLQREKRERKEKKVIHRVSPALAIAVLAPIGIVQRENEKSEKRKVRYEERDFVALVRNHLSQ